MVTLRLQRIGRKNEPHYRVVATDARFAPKAGKFLEIVGSYNPKMGKVQLDAERVKYWLSQGATTSDTVNNFLVDQKIIEGKKKAPAMKKVKAKK